MNYAALASTATQRIKEFGTAVSIERAGVKVGSGHAVFVDDTTENERQSRSSLLANTSTRTRKAIVTATVKTVQAGDRLIADKVTYTVHAVSTFRPSTTTLAYEVEIV